MKLFAVVALSSSLLLHSSGTLILSADGLTVTDSANNITWLADANLAASNRFGLPLCNGSAIGTAICVNASGSMNYQAAAAWVAAMNAANYLGHNNWQLPTTPLLDSNCGKTGPAGDSFGFGCTAGALDSMYNALGLKSPNTAVPIPANTAGPFSNLQPYLYWSQTSAGPTSGNSTFSFATGWQGSNTLPNFLYLLPMVPGKLAGTPAATGTGLEVNPGGQTVYDPMTDTTWMANANLAASNTFGLPLCTTPTAPTLCVAADGSMTWASAMQFLANMNAAAYLGQMTWQAPAIDAGCPGYTCAGTLNPMGNLYYAQLALSAGTSAVAVPEISVGPFHDIQPYLYWTCGGAAIQSACQADGPVSNQEWSYSFGAGFQGTDVLANSLYVTAYFVGNRSSASGPVVTKVANAEGEAAAIAPNTWVEVKGVNLAPAGDTRTWQSSNFVNGQMPTALNGVSVSVNGKPAYVSYISPAQVNILTPPDAISGNVAVTVSISGTAGTGYSAIAQSMSPSFFVFNGGPYVAATHADGSLIGPPTLYLGSSTPAQPGETILLYANGFGPISAPVAAGAGTQYGTLATLPAVTIGGVAATVKYAGINGQPGEFQFNVVIPPSLANGDQPISATYAGFTTQPGTLITIQK